MQSTNYCQFCKSKEINILGKSVKVKNYICSPDGINYREKDENIQMQLFISPISYCPAGCLFCVAKNTKTEQRLDIDKFAETMKLLKAEDRIRGIKITGGEPFYDIDLLNEIVSILFEIFGYEMEISVSTNAIGLEQLHKIKDLEHIDAIHISRHHYNDEINRRLFGGAPVPSSKEIKKIVSSVSFRDIFVYNAMLLKDYLNSPGEAHKFLDFAIETGVPKVGFMVCSPINKFAEEQSIPYEDVIRENDPLLLFTRGYFDYEYCHCSDGIYSSEDGRIVEFYGRSTKMVKYEYCRGLVYETDNFLRDGFGGNIIF